jgi:hypothetical protein
VLGIDADGRTAEGSLQLSGDELALVLPGSFVDAASYPLRARSPGRQLDRGGRERQQTTPIPTPPST